MVLVGNLKMQYTAWKADLSFQYQVPSIFHKAGTNEARFFCSLEHSAAERNTLGKREGFAS